MRDKLYGLQGLRAIAAAFVVFVHAVSTYREKVDAASGFFPGFPTGESGVQLFFAISGFIIYTASINMAPGFGSAKLFAWRRLVRVVPLYWLATIVYAIKLALVTESPTGAELFKSLFFVPYGGYVMRPVLGAGWTLNFEMFFYLVFFLTLFSPKVWRLPAMLAFFVSVRLCGELGLFESPNGSWVMAHLSQPYLDYFIVGMLIGYGRSLLTKSAYKIEISATAAIFVSAAVFSVGFAVLGVLRIYSGPLPLALVAVSLAIATLEGPKNTADVRRYFWLIAAGDASFSTYLTHGFVMGPAARILDFAGERIPIVFFAVAMVILCTIAGYILYRIVEQPILKKFSPKSAAKQRTAVIG